MTTSSEEEGIFAAGINERSVTSSQYMGSSVLLHQPQHPKQQLEFNRLETAKDTGFMALDEANQLRESECFALPYDLPHASSRVFDEGDMPIPAKFSRQRRSNPHKQLGPAKRKSINTGVAVPHKLPAH